MGIVRIERPLSARIDDTNSEVNLFNQNGITTAFNHFGGRLIPLETIAPSLANRDASEEF
ncbi:MAG: hypothetical protein ACTS85_00065 [Arsenophonus sp. NC-PG7-MAG3]